jgi:hypothetical protein
MMRPPLLSRLTKMFWFRPNIPSFSSVPSPIRSTISILSLLVIMTCIKAPLASGFEAFSDNQCIETSFKLIISHPSGPFGLTPRILSLQKDKCTLIVKHERLKFLTEAWTIDICRGPIHIKKGLSSIEVLKKEGPCSKKEFKSTPFCAEWKKIRHIIQDDGLIFAVGEKENLTDDHGKIYCSYLLINLYLQEGVVLSRGRDIQDNLLNRNNKTQFQSEEELIPPPKTPAETPPETPAKETVPTSQSPNQLPGQSLNF